MSTTYPPSLVFVTKYRRNVFTAPMPARCQKVMREIHANFACEPLDLDGHDDHDDHVHPLVGFPPKVALSALVNPLKGVSAPYPRKEYDSHVREYLWDGHLWSRS